MKPMGENEVLHLGNTIADWRVIAECLHQSAEVVHGPIARQYGELADRIEMHLPSNVSDLKE